jgi:hypothetical protein
MMMMIMSMGWDYFSELPPGDIRAWKTMVDEVNWEKLPISPPEHSLVILPAEPSSSKLEESE